MSIIATLAKDLTQVWLDAFRTTVEYHKKVNQLSRLKFIINSRYEDVKVSNETLYDNQAFGL